MDKKNYTTTEILRAEVKYLQTYCGDTCNFKSEDWKKARRKFHEGKIDVTMLERVGLLIAKT
jgi:hypothetical protein